MTVTNPYYEFDPAFTPGGVARSGDINTQLQAVQTAFDFLPGSNDAITTGTVTFAPESGSGNAYVVTMPDTRSSNSDGDEIIFFASHTNTGAATLNVDGIGAVAMTDRTGVALVTNDIVEDRLYMATYDATNVRFVLDVTTNVVTNVIDKVQGIGTVAPEDGPATMYANLDWVNANDEVLFKMGFPGSAFQIRNMSYNAITVVAGTNTAGGETSFLSGHPEGQTIISAGTNLLLKVAGNATLETALVATANAGVDLYYNNVQEAATADGGLKATNFFHNRTETETNLLDSTHAVNTSNGKIAGAQVYDSTNGTPLWADGPAADDPWADATGTPVHVPSP